jgi:hypothetical protein
MLLPHLVFTGLIWSNLVYAETKNHLVMLELPDPFSER